MPNRRRRLVGMARHGVPLAVVAALLVTVATTATVGAVAQDSGTVAAKSRTLHIAPLDAIRRLTVAKHSHGASYDRQKDFGHWIRQGRGCNTRAVVLEQESREPTTHSGACIVRTGRWLSYFNARYYTQADALQIDHTVGVENAWVSGAWRWTHQTRVRYYNDLGDTRTLVAVDRDDNVAKGEQDPTTWLPKRGHCSFVRHWITVKTRWHLSVTAAEKTTLRKLAHGCDARSLTIRLATIRYR
jgi:hypothetical protein